MTTLLFSVFCTYRLKLTIDCLIISSFNCKLLSGTIETFSLLRLINLRVPVKFTCNISAFLIPHKNYTKSACHSDNESSQ